MYIDNSLWNIMQFLNLNFIVITAEKKISVVLFGIIYQQQWYKGGGILILHFILQIKKIIFYNETLSNHDE